MTNQAIYDRVRKLSGDLSHQRGQTREARRRLVDWASGDLYPSTAVIILPRSTWLRWIALLRE